MAVTELLITEKIVATLAENKVPWRGDYGFPKNISNDFQYRGVNALLLNMAAAEHGFTTAYWGTWSQWRAQGRDINKTQPGTKIVQSNKDHFSFWTVYNLDQVEGGFANQRKSIIVDYQQIDNLIVDTKAKINFQFGTKAAYVFPPFDYIIFPLKEQFVIGPGGLPGYYNSIFHEVAHWTEPRLHWQGTEEAKELRAEITADFLTTKFGVPEVNYELRTNHHFFLKRWADMLCQDPTTIFQIADAASQAMNYITGDNNDN